MQASSDIFKALPTMTQTVEVKPHARHSKENGSLFSDLLDTYDRNSGVEGDQLTDTSNLQDTLLLSHPPLENALTAPPAGPALQHISLITPETTPGSLPGQDASGIGTGTIEAEPTDSQTSPANVPAASLARPTYSMLSGSALSRNSQDQAILAAATQNAEHIGATTKSMPEQQVTANQNTIPQDIGAPQLTSATAPKSLTDPRIKSTAATGEIISALAPENLDQKSEASPLLSAGASPAPVNAPPSETLAIPHPPAQPEITALAPSLDAIDLSQTSIPQSDSSSGLGLAQNTITTPAAPASLPPAPAPANPIVASPKDIPTVISESLPTADPDNSRIMVQLDPPELGRVTIDFRFEGQVLQAVTITGESPEALRQLRHMHFELIQALEQNGLSNSDLEFRQEQSPQHQFNNSPSDPQTADEGLDMPGQTDWPVTKSPSAPKSNHTQTALDIRV